MDERDDNGEPTAREIDHDAPIEGAIDINLTPEEMARVVALHPAAFERVESLIETPPEPTPALRELMAEVRTAPAGDDLYASLQTPAIREATARGLNATPEEMGRAAVAAVRRERLDHITALAVCALGDPAKAARWLRKPCRALGDKRPIDLIGSPDGAAMVETVLGRIEYGVYQ